MVKQWTAAHKLTFSVLVFSLTMIPFTFAQEIDEEEMAPALQSEEVVEQEAPVSPAVSRREATRANVQGGTATQVTTQPVVVTSSMAPAQVPQALPARTYADQRALSDTSTMPQGMVVTAPGTGIGGSNPGNANTGGVQVQSVTVQANPQADSAAGNENVSDILRRHRIRSEVDNENRLIERLEMGRLEDERMRAQSIDGFHSSVGNSAAASNNSQAASAQTSGDQSPATAIAAGQGSTVTVQQVTPTDESAVAAVPYGSSLYHRASRPSETSFGIAPFLGRRWYTSGNDFFDVQNRFVTGLTMEGSLGSFFGLEGNFTFAKDEIEDISGIGGAYGYQPGGAYYYGAPTRERETFEIGIAAKVGNQFGRFRPFGVIGLGARQARYKIDDQYTTQLAEQAGWQRSTNKMLGLFGLGVDIRLAENIGLGGRFDYQAVLNKKDDYMNMLYDDSSNSYQGVGTIKIAF